MAVGELLRAHGCWGTLDIECRCFVLGLLGPADDVGQASEERALLLRKLGRDALRGTLLTVEAYVNVESLKLVVLVLDDTYLFGVHYFLCDV